MVQRRNNVARPVQPNVGLEVAYRRRLTALIDEMNKSLAWWVSAAYRAHTPATAVLADNLATDGALPADLIARVIRRLTAKWLAKFNEIAPAIADWFATAVADRSDATMKAALKRGGLTVAFKPSAAVRDSIAANVAENVALIKSIGAEHLSAVEGYVMRSVQAGGDLGPLAKELASRYGVSKRRAALIARHQNNLATANMTRIRQMELGIIECVWVHSAGGREPRPSHVKAGRDHQRYDPAVGWLDPHEGRRIFPGTLINCRCTSRVVIPGLDVFGKSKGT